MERQMTLDPPSAPSPPAMGSRLVGDRAPWQWGVGEAGQTHLPLVAWVGQSW